MQAKNWIDLCLIAGFKIGISSEATAQTPAPEAARAAFAIPAGTSIDFQIVDHISSKISKATDNFTIRLSRPILVDGHEIVPVGTEGVGEVIHAARARAGGKAGELILTARYLLYHDQKIPLRSFRFGKSGESRVTQGAVVAFAAGPLSYLIVGGEVDVPPLTYGNAVVREAISITESGGTK